MISILANTATRKSQWYTSGEVNDQMCCIEVGVLLSWGYTGGSAITGKMLRGDWVVRADPMFTDKPKLGHRMFMMYCG